jgi:hypothetical protein
MTNNDASDLLSLMYSDTDFAKSIEISKKRVSENGGWMTNIDEFMLKHEELLSLSPEKRKEIIDELGKPMSLYEFNEKWSFNR